jgi:hypothetical protein
VTDIFPRESGWDSSVREEPLGEFCRKHGFYDCPVCRGEEPVWVIPIEDGSRVTGNIYVHEGGSVTITGSSNLPEPAATVVVRLPPVPQEFSHAWEAPDAPQPEAKVVPRPPRLSRSQVAAVAALFRASILDEPWVREAEARGRKVHDDAVALMESESLSYAEAIEKVLDERA